MRARAFLSAALALAMGAFAPMASAQVRNVDLSTYLVPHATGRGPDYAQAARSAREAAVERAAFALYLQTPAEQDAFGERRAPIMAHLDELVADAQLLDKDREERTVIVDLEVTVRRAALRDLLARQGLLAPSASREAPRVLVVLDAASRDRPLAGFAVSRIQAYLSAQQVDCVEVDTLQGLLDDDRALAGGGAVSPELAVSSQADLVVRVTAEVRSTRRFGDHDLFQAMVALSAQAPASETPETRTYLSRELTFAHEDREKARRAAIEEAIGGAIEPLMLELTRQWKVSAAQGRLYQVRYRSRAGASREKVARWLAQHATLEQRRELPGECAVLLRSRVELSTLIEGLVQSWGTGLTVESEAPTQTILRGP